LGQLRSVGNSRAAKLTILIPLIGYLVLLNDAVVKKLKLSEEIFGDAADATLTKLLFIYCGLVFVAIASIIFARWCPREVKRYASSEECLAGEEPFLSGRTIALVETRLRLGDDIAREDDAGYREYYRSRPSVDDLGELRKRARDLTRIQMNLFFEMLDRSAPVARWAAAICYMIGLGLLLIPSVTVFVKVMIVLAHRIAAILTFS
jgi:hypothetical protein